MENEKTVYEELEIEVIRFEEDNVITEVFMKGYKLGDRIVRHAAVKVVN